MTQTPASPAFPPNLLLRTIILAILAVSLANYLLRLIPFSVIEYGPGLAEPMKLIEMGGAGLDVPKDNMAMSALFEFWLVLSIQSILSISLLVLSGARELCRLRGSVSNTSRISKRSYLIIIVALLLNAIIFITPNMFAEILNSERMLYLPYSLRLGLVALTTGVLLAISATYVFDPTRAQWIMKHVRMRNPFGR